MKRPLPRCPWPALLALTPACAAQGGGEGGADNLPDRGISGWERSATDPTRPFVLSVDDALLGGPSALVTADTVVVYGHRKLTDGSFELFRTDGDATGASFAAPVALTSAPADGSSGLPLAGRDPSIVHVDGVFWLAYVSPDDAIVVATSSAGIAFQPIATTGLSAARSAPSLVVEGARVRLYLATGTTLVHTEAPRGDTLAFGPEVEVLRPGVDCVDPSGEAEACWDEDAIVEAEVRRATTPTGGSVYRMFYAANAGGDSDIGFAASYDGVTFARFPYNPVLTGSFDEHSPTSVIADDVYLLFWDEARSTTSGGLVRAVHIPTAPSDRW